MEGVGSHKSVNTTHLASKSEVKSSTRSKAMTVVGLVAIGMIGLSIFCFAAGKFAPVQALAPKVKEVVIGGAMVAVAGGAYYSALKLDTRTAKERIHDLLTYLCYDPSFEETRKVKSSRFDVNGFCLLNDEDKLPELPHGRIMLVNGVAGEEQKLQERLCTLSTYTQIGRKGENAYNVHGVWNATHGVVTDLLEARGNIFGGKATEPSALLAEAWIEFYNQHRDDPDARVLQICHSQGAAHVRNALRMVPREVRKRIEVVAIAPGAYIPQELCARVVHYRRNGDPVPLLDTDGKEIARDQNTVFLVPKADGAPSMMDHSMSSESFRPVLQFEVADFVSRMESVRAS
jgi:Protein of unknown function (DUF687)